MADTGHSYVVTGVSRGLGYEFLRQYSENPKNVVIGVVRNKTSTEAKIKADQDLVDRSNIHILEADVADYHALKKAADATSEITGGELDYLIHNAGFVSTYDAYDGPGTLGDDPENVAATLHELNDVHVIGTVFVFNTFLPLIHKGAAKKVIAITSGYSDIQPAREFGLDVAPFYSASKAAQNVIVAKYHAQYKQDGILFLAVAPGVVDVGKYSQLTPEQMQKLGVNQQKFLQFAPDFKGPLTPKESIGMMRSVIDHATVEKEGGDYVSQHGNKQWI